MLKYIFTENQIKTIIKGQLNEQQNSSSEDLKIKQLIINSVFNAGTNETKFVDALKMIKNVTQFNSVDGLLKNDRSLKGRGIEYYINDEFDAQDYKYIVDIVNHFKSIGVGVKYTGIRGPGAGKIGRPTFTPGGFKLGKPSSTPQVDQNKRQTYINKIYMGAGGNTDGIIKSTGSKWDNRKLSDFIAVYKPTQQEIITAQKYAIEQGKKELTTKSTTTNKKKPVTQFTANENFPIKYGQKGSKIKKLQGWLGLKGKQITGNFYNLTETLVKNKMKKLGLKYDRNVGIDEKTFTKLTTNTKQTDEPTKDELTPFVNNSAGVNINTNTTPIDGSLAGIDNKQTDII